MNRMNICDRLSNSRAITSRLSQALVVGMMSLASLTITIGSDIPSEHAQFFENDVRPLLVKHCYECHSEDDPKGGLRLDSRSLIMAGGDSGEAMVPGKPDESILIDAINYGDYEMPPTGKLPDKEIAILTRWVSMGAPWPGEDPNAPVRKKDRFDQEDRAWWAIQPVSRPSVPEVDATNSKWARGDLDRFVIDSMTKQGLAPAPEADKLATVRRLYLDVVGLPPTPEQVDAYLGDESPDAYERLVDDLLQSKGYGEHAARQWLDLVRYADSDGYRADEYRPNAWRYRDYVIKSFNDDKPYDRFLLEQLAGDELFPDSVEAQVALGYLRHWVYEWNISDAKTQWKTILDDVTDTTADAFLGLGLQCAKCHNHKFDPLLQKDYFRLQAFFAPLMPQELDVVPSSELVAYREQMKAWEDKTADVRSTINEIELPYREKLRTAAIDRFPADLKEIAYKPAGELTPYEEQMAYLIQRQIAKSYDNLDQKLSSEDKDKLVILRRDLKAFDELKPKPLPIAMGVSDVGTEAPPVVMPKRKDEIVEPGIPTILNEDALTIASSPSGLTTGRRTALAKWVTDPANPLSTRVIANRIWQSHFGRGLAANPSDFGRLGGPPTHPELLDWLTIQFIEGGWSLKLLHRKILLSATYRQSTQHPRFDEFHQFDPANTYYWRRDTMRLSAEEIRDALLVSSGQLKDSEGGPGKLGDATCRTIYTRMMRNSPDQLLDGFDLPQFFSSNSTRNTTTTPVQSLMMINSDRLLGYSRKLASLVKKESNDPATQVTLAWKRVFSRDPSPEEIESSLRFIDNQREEISKSESDASAGLIETAKLPYRDGQSIRFVVNDSVLKLSVPYESAMDTGDFTIETFFQIRSIADNADVRTLVSKWDCNQKFPGWRLGVTGAGSRRKPNTMVLQAVGTKADGKLGEAAIFSDQHIQINTPYYASASFRLPRDGKGGTVTFFLKDLSNDDEPILVAEIPHDLTGGMNNALPLTFGGCSGASTQAFDGLIDDVRFVGKALTIDEILQTVERDLPATIGYWRFETVPGVMRNSTGDRLKIVGRGKAIVNLSAEESALADFCHALLNANEFLYKN
ncbi:MAG: DUF1549 domain-containing protein [Planctomycetota bacterium]|nr:DUF1549 domain-containing protein [Planctomycetota bacterium]